MLAARVSFLRQWTGNIRVNIWEDPNEKYPNSPIPLHNSMYFLLNCLLIKIEKVWVE